MGIFQFAYIEPWSEMRVCEKRKSAKGTHTMFLAIWGPSWTRSFTFNVSASQSFPSSIIWEIHCIYVSMLAMLEGGSEFAQRPQALWAATIRNCMYNISWFRG